MYRRTFLQLSAALGLGSLFVGFDHLLGSTIGAPFPVYFTFEGGPSIKADGTGSTIDVLNVLAKYQVPATFFVTGRNLHDQHNALLARMLGVGHAIGNRLWQETGNAASDQSTPSLLAEQFLKTEKRIRGLIQTSNADAAAAYDKQPKLYRRPGGDSVLATPLDLVNFAQLTHEPYLKNYADTLNWLKTVFDYSGWHISAGDSQPSSKKLSSQALARRVVNGEKGAQGASAFLCVTANQKRATEIGQGLIVQLFDNDKLTADSIASLIIQLRVKGAQFFALPRPVDAPNTFVLGVEDLPTADNSPSAVACNAVVTITPTSLASPTGPATIGPTDSGSSAAGLLATSSPK